MIESMELMKWKDEGEQMKWKVEGEVKGMLKSWKAE